MFFTCVSVSFVHKFQILTRLPLSASPHQKRAHFSPSARLCAAWCSQLWRRITTACRSRPPLCSPHLHSRQVRWTLALTADSGVRFKFSSPTNMSNAPRLSGLLLDSDIELAVDHLTRLLLMEEDDRVRSAYVEHTWICLSSPLAPFLYCYNIAF